MLAIAVHTIYGLFVLCTDMVFVVLFPQLFCVFYLPTSNSYGSFFGYMSGAFLRLIGGEPVLGLPALVTYPFAYKSLAMLINFICIILVSHLARVVFRAGWLPMRLDVFECFHTSADNDSKDKNTRKVNGEHNSAYSDDEARSTKL